MGVADPVLRRRGGRGVRAVYALALPETPSFTQAETCGEIVRRPPIAAVREFPRETTHGLVIQAGHVVQFYLWTVFLPSFAALMGIADCGMRHSAVPLRWWSYAGDPGAGRGV